MKSCDSEIQKWCERKYHDVVSVLGTDDVDIHIYAYTTSAARCEWIVCDFFACTDKSKYADTTFSFGDKTNLDDLYSPSVKDVVILFQILDELTKRFYGKIYFGMSARIHQ
ncbi:hypothetical protein [Escherichia coli]|uniref:hypothetical protein n=1 Tax=Escherichia coli TaxID=562 RepID=UPI0015C4E693|nr:hypothetical protein [Escherichia coli]